MTITDALGELSRFVDAVRRFFPDLCLTVPRPLDAKIFPDELVTVKPPESGLYLLFRNDTAGLLYVGVSNYIPGRIYEHIGKGFAWARGGAQCNFPNMELAAQRPWLAESTQALLRRGGFGIQVVGVEPSQCAGLLEAFLVVRGFVMGQKPEINVRF